MQHMKDLGNYEDYLKSYAKYRNEDVEEYHALWDRYLADLGRTRSTPLRNGSSIFGNMKKY